MLQLFPIGGATDIVFVTLFCIAVGTEIAWCGGRMDTALTFCSSGGGLRQPWSSLALFRGFTLLSPFSHSSPSLIGLLASVDVKQQSLSLSLSLSLPPSLSLSLPLSLPPSLSLSLPLSLSCAALLPDGRRWCSGFCPWLPPGDAGNARAQMSVLVSHVLFNAQLQMHSSSSHV